MVTWLFNNEMSIPPEKTTLIMQGRFLKEHIHYIAYLEYYIWCETKIEPFKFLDPVKGEVQIDDRI